MLSNQEFFEDIIESVYFINYSFSFSVKWNLFSPKWTKSMKKKFVLDKDMKSLSKKKGNALHL